MGRPRVRVERLLADYPAPTPQPTPCRLWQGAIDGDGYGCLSGNHAKVRAHQWVWEQANGPIKTTRRNGKRVRKFVVRHKCDNRLCFRLSHLELGTIADNNRDAAERGHLGAPRALAPSEAAEVLRRHEAGESYRQIHRDFPHVSLATIKRVNPAWLEEQ